MLDFLILADLYGHDNRVTGVLKKIGRQGRAGQDTGAK
jgi:hypothetical protein